MELKNSSSSGITRTMPTRSVKAAMAPSTELSMKRLRRAKYMLISDSSRKVLAGMVQVSKKLGGKME